MTFFNLLLICLTAPVWAQPTFPGETEARRDARMQWWRDAKFGMFIHWGACTVHGGVWKGEARGDAYRLMLKAKIPPAEYAQAVKSFNPTQFDPDRWVEIAEQAGMKYMVLIANHHDGFAMWDTKVSDFNVVDFTPYGKDIVKQMADACQRHDMKFGVYYSQARDWYHPGGALGHNDKPWDAAQEGSFADYVHKIAIPQTRELLTNYGPIAELWWDTPMDMTPELAEEFTQLLPLQPDIVTNDRLLYPSGQNGEGGDFSTPERSIPAQREPGRDMEVCMTIGNTWMWSIEDGDYKSKEELLETLLRIVSKGGNLLLNVSPSPEGVIPDWQVERILYMGHWLKKYGDAIYGTRQGPFRYWRHGYATTKDNKLNLLITDWPSGGKLNVPIANTPAAAYAMADPTQIFTFESTDKGLLIDVPSRPLDTRVSVIVLEMNEPAVAIRQGRLPDEDGVYRLTAVDGERHGLSLRLEGEVIPRWNSDTYTVTWPMYIEKPGAYQVRVQYACQPDKAGGSLQASFNDQKLIGQTQATASIEDFQTVDLGTVSFDKAQSVEVEFKLPTRTASDAVGFKALFVRPQ